MGCVLNKPFRGEGGEGYRLGLTTKLKDPGDFIEVVMDDPARHHIQLGLCEAIFGAPPALCGICSHGHVLFRLYGAILRDLRKIIY